MTDYRVVDVFTATPFRGNPVAVVFGADGLDAAQMQRIAAWTNLSETTFHLAPTVPQADYRLRIFTPRSELPFAGHPTLGSAHALIEAGRVRPKGGRVVQQCAAGLIPIALEGAGTERRLQLQMPVAAVAPLADAAVDRLARVLGQAPVAPPALVDVGPKWVIADLGVADRVIAATPDLGAMAALEQELGATGVTIFGRHATDPSALEVRSFAPSDGLAEDPVCGSGNGAVAAWRLAQGQIGEGTRYAATQGRCVGRDGQIAITVEGGRVFVAGQAVTTVVGTLQL